MKKTLLLSALGLFVVGFTLGHQAGERFFSWYLFPLLVRGKIELVQFVPPAEQRLTIAVYAGLLFAVGPICVLIAGRQSRLPFWGSAFGLLALLISSGVAIFIRTYPRSNWTSSPLLPAPEGSPWVGSLGPVAAIFLSGMAVALGLACIKRLKLQKARLRDRISKP